MWTWNEAPFKIASAAVGAIALTVSSGYKAVSWHNDTFAERNDVVLVEMRLEQKILTDRSSQIQQRMWKIEDRYGLDLKDAPETVKEEYRQLQDELDDLDKELVVLQQEYRQMNRGSGYYGKDYKRGK